MVAQSHGLAPRIPILDPFLDVVKYIPQRWTRKSSFCSELVCIVGPGLFSDYFKEEYNKPLKALTSSMPVCIVSVQKKYQRLLR